MIKFRNPLASEIDARINTINSKGLTLLLYQDARAGMTILDETVGPENWQRHHELIDGKLFCSVGININYDRPEKEPYFIWKQDVGVESYTEKEKGQASDSFKRAVVNWGVCRCLYSSPFIWIPAEKCNIKPSGRRDSKGNDIMTCYDKFAVEQIIYNDDNNIVALSIRNKTTGQRVFLYDAREKAQNAV